MRQGFLILPKAFLLFSFHSYSGELFSINVKLIENSSCLEGCAFALLAADLSAFSTFSLSIL